MEADRKEHVVVRAQGYGTAVALLPTMTFVRCGPRAKPHRVKIFAKAGFGTLVGRNGQPPDWRFHSDVCFCEEEECECEQVHYGSIARRVMDVEERMPGSVNEEMVAECEARMQEM